MALAYLLDPSFQTLNENGRPLVGGYIEVYRHNTSVPYVTKADFEGTNNPFKVPLNSKGMAVIIASDMYAYDVFCYDAFGALYWSRQNVNTIGGSGGGGDEDIYEIAMFDLSQAGNSLYNDIDAKLGEGLLPVIAAGSQGAVRYYYYTARDSQAHTMTFTCGHNGSVELLVLKDDDTYTLNKAVDVPLVRVAFRNGVWSKISGDDGFIKPNPWGVASLYLPENSWWHIGVVLAVSNNTPRDLIQHLQLIYDWNSFLSSDVPPITYGEAQLPSMTYEADFTRVNTNNRYGNVLYKKDGATEDWLTVALTAYHDTLPNDLEWALWMNISKVRDA